MSTRREFLVRSAAFAICASPPLHGMTVNNGDQDTAPCSQDIFIPTADLAKLLLTTKIHRTIFKPPEVMRNVRRFFDLPYYNWVIEGFAILQINNTVEQFNNNNILRNNSKTPFKGATVGELEREYQAHLSRRFHQEMSSDYVEFLSLSSLLQNRQAPTDPGQNATNEEKRKYRRALEQKQKLLQLNEKYSKMEQVFGCPMDQQFGYKKVYEDGRIEFNPKWNEVSLWDRPPLMLDHIIRALNINPSPFVITVADIKALGIPLEVRPKAAAASAQLGGTIVLQIG